MSERPIETETGTRKGERVSKKLIRWLFQRRRISGWNGAVFVAALRVIKVRKEKRAATPPSTPEIPLPAVSQASYWERGNPSAATRRNLAVSQALLFAVLRTGRIWFLCSRNREPKKQQALSWVTLIISIQVKLQISQICQYWIGLSPQFE